MAWPWPSSPSPAASSPPAPTPRAPATRRPSPAPSATWASRRPGSAACPTPSTRPWASRRRQTRLLSSGRSPSPAKPAPTSSAWSGTRRLTNIVVILSPSLRSGQAPRRIWRVKTPARIAQCYVYIMTNRSGSRLAERGYRGQSLLTGGLGGVPPTLLMKRRSRQVLAWKDEDAKPAGLDSSAAPQNDNGNRSRVIVSGAENLVNHDHSPRDSIDG